MNDNLIYSCSGPMASDWWIGVTDDLRVISVGPVPTNLRHAAARFTFLLDEERKAHAIEAAHLAEELESARPTPADATRRTLDAADADSWRRLVTQARALGCDIRRESVFAWVGRLARPADSA